MLYDIKKEKKILKNIFKFNSIELIKKKFEIFNENIKLNILNDFFYLIFEILYFDNNNYKISEETINLLLENEFIINNINKKIIYQLLKNCIIFNLNIIFQKIILKFYDKVKKILSDLIFIAVDNNSYEILIYLISELKININNLDYTCKTILHIAIKNESYNIIQYLLNENNLNPYIIDVSGNNIFFSACRSNSLKLFKYLKKKININLDQKNDYGENILHYLLRKNSNDENLLEFIKYLIDDLQFKGDTKNKKGNTILHYACYYSNIEIVRFLIGRSFKIKNNNKKESILFSAARNDLKILRYLIEEIKLDVYQINSKDENLLFSAVKSNDITIFKYLYYNFYLDYKILNNKNESLLFKAVKNDEPIILNFLINELGFDTNILNINGKNILFNSFKNHNINLIIDLIYKKNINYLQISKDNENILFSLTLNYYTSDQLKLFINNINYNQINNDGENILFNISRINNLELLIFCIEKLKINYNLINNNGENLLFSAIENKKSLTIYLNYLYKKLKLNVNLKNNYNESILYKACIIGNYNAVKFFIKKNIKINYYDKIDNIYYYLKIFQYCKLEILIFLLEKTQLKNIIEENNEIFYYCKINNDKRVQEYFNNLNIKKNYTYIVGHINNNNNNNLHVIVSFQNKNNAIIFIVDILFSNFNKNKKNKKIYSYLNNNNIDINKLFHNLSYLIVKKNIKLYNYCQDIIEEKKYIIKKIYLYK